MILLKLSLNSHARLAAQVALTGTFEHTLRNDQGVASTVKVDVLQCSNAVSVMVRAGSSNTGATFARPVCPRRTARLIESVANGMPFSDAPFEEECALISEIELILREAIQSQRGTYWLSPDDDLEVELLMQPSQASLRIGETKMDMHLPVDRDAAYDRLSDNLQRFLDAVRATAQAA